MIPARYIVEGFLKVLTPLAIRLGHEGTDFPAMAPEVEPNAPPQLEGANAGPAPIAAIELDHRGLPFLPATAIKGLLRSHAASALDDQYAEMIQRLLGDLPRKGADAANPLADAATGGIVDFRHAFLPPGCQPQARPAIRGRTALHEGSRTAEEGQLRHDRIVAPGTEFPVTILLTRATAQDVATLLALLALIGGADAASALGAGAAQGDGRVAWTLVSVRQFGPAEAVAWVNAPAGTGWQDHATEISLAPALLTTRSDLRIDLQLALQIEGHFLVGAQEIYTNDKGKEARRTRPYRVDADDERIARLAGSSLDGALRAQARRIYRTISGDTKPWSADDTDLPPAFEALFGSPRQGSMLEVETFLFSAKKLVEHEFVAIDRLSGGSADEKKFALKAFEAPLLTGTLRLVMQRSVTPSLTGKSGMTLAVGISLPAIGLLALTLKDLASADIPLGHGTRKGYGGVAALTFANGGWRALLEHLGAEAARMAGSVPSLEALERLAPHAVIELAVTALHDEAMAWATKRGVLAPAVAEGVTE